jgi:hypothetical protein
MLGDLFCKCEALSSNTSPTKNKTNNNKKKKTERSCLKWTSALKTPSGECCSLAFRVEAWDMTANLRV